MFVSALYGDFPSIQKKLVSLFRNYVTTWLLVEFTFAKKIESHGVLWKFGREVNHLTGMRADGEK